MKDSMLQGNKPNTIFSTPAPACPACEAGKRHTDGETAEFHPLAGHGRTKEIGWTHPTLVALAGAQLSLAAKEMEG